MNDLLKMVHSMKKLYERLCVDVIQKHNITRNELEILLFLYNNPELTSAKDLVEKRGMTKSHASLGIEQLISKGYLESIQDHKDKRKYHLYLQETAMPIIQDGMLTRRKFNTILLNGLTDEECIFMKRIFNQMFLNIQEEEM